MLSKLNSLFSQTPGFLTAFELMHDKFQGNSTIDPLTLDGSALQNAHDSELLNMFHQRCGLADSDYFQGGVTVVTEIKTSYVEMQCFYVCICINGS